MTCLHCQGADGFFDTTMAERDLRKYLKRGPNRTTRMLLEELEARGIDGASLLDIGGGIGVIQHEFFRRGVVRATHIDASQAYLEVARHQSRELGNEERTTFLLGDFVERAPEIDRADVVTLDRVICCYPDLATLVKYSSAMSHKLYGVCYLRDTWWVKPVVVGINAFLRLKRSTFRVFAHSTAQVERLMAEQGFRRSSRRTTFVWQVAVYVRQAA